MRQALVVTGGFLVVTLVGLAGGADAQTSRPFDNYSRSPSVSPYMNLVNNNNTTDANVFLNYQLLVKPQLEQRNFNQQTAATFKQFQQTQKTSVAKPQSGVEGNQRLRATGHAATRGNYSHYYPSLNRQ